ncbi:hypothetical protein HYY69_05705 [Candidatus Woesearchaeota archaeon]|nr:hypothetical protein [Candidatus Woesearchaeota archaeon]
MDVIILGGMSKKSNQQWVEYLTAALQSSFPNAAYHTIRYDHWNTSDQDFDRDKEENKLEEEIAQITGDYVVVAKSVGSIITLDAAVSGRIQPKFSVLMGFPLYDSFDVNKNVQEKYAQLLQGYQVPSLIIQNPDERYIHPQPLRDLLAVLGVRNTTVVEGYGGKEHSYNIDCVRAVFLKEIRRL